MERGPPQSLPTPPQGTVGGTRRDLSSLFREGCRVYYVLRFPLFYCHRRQGLRCARIVSSACRREGLRVTTSTILTLKSPRESCVSPPPTPEVPSHRIHESYQIPQSRGPKIRSGMVDGPYTGIRSQRV